MFLVLIKFLSKYMNQGDKDNIAKYLGKKVLSKKDQDHKYELESINNEYNKNLTKVKDGFNNILKDAPSYVNAYYAGLKRWIEDAQKLNAARGQIKVMHEQLKYLSMHEQIHNKMKEQIVNYDFHKEDPETLRDSLYELLEIEKVDNQKDVIDELENNIITVDQQSIDEEFKKILAEKVEMPKLRN